MPKKLGMMWKRWPGINCSLCLPVQEPGELWKYVKISSKGAGSKTGRKRNVSLHSTCLNSVATLLCVQKETGQIPEPRTVLSWYHSVWQLMSWCSWKPCTKSWSPPVSVLRCKSGYHHLSPEAGDTPPCSTKKEALPGAARIFKKQIWQSAVFSRQQALIYLSQPSLQMAMDWPGACPHLLPLLCKGIGPTLFPDKRSFLQAQKKHVVLPNSHPAWGHVTAYCCYSSHQF